MISRRGLGWVVLVWTAISWGGRISLLTGSDSTDVGSWIRIGGSIVVGAAMAGALLLGRWVRPMAYGFAAWVTVIWARSLWTVWTEQANSVPFKLVHTVLAVVWAVLVVLVVRRDHRDAAVAGSGSGTGVPGSTSSASRRTTSSADR